MGYSFGSDYRIIKKEGLTLTKLKEELTTLCDDDFNGVNGEEYYVTTTDEKRFLIMFREKIKSDLMHLIRKRLEFKSLLNSSNDNNLDDYYSQMLELIEEGIINLSNELESIKEDYPVKNHRWIHYTSDDNYTSILKKGFSLSKEDARFGNGIYFTRNESYIYPGSKKIEVNILAPILSLWHYEICEIFNKYNLQPEEEGLPAIEKYIKGLGHKALEVKYFDGSSELVVYDKSLIKIAL